MKKRLLASVTRPYDVIEAGQRLANKGERMVDEGVVGTVTHNLGTDQDGVTAVRVQLHGTDKIQIWRYRPGVYVELHWSTPVGRSLEGVAA